MRPLKPGLARLVVHVQTELVLRTQQPLDKLAGVAAYPRLGVDQWAGIDTDPHLGEFGDFWRFVYERLVAEKLSVEFGLTFAHYLSGEQFFVTLLSSTAHCCGELRPAVKLIHRLAELSM